MLARIIKVVVEIVIQLVGALCRLNHDKPERATSYHAIAQQLPINLTLIVRDVDAVYLITIGIVGITIKRAPPEPGRTHEKLIECPHVEQRKDNPPYPNGPSGTSNEESRAFLSDSLSSFSCWH